MKESNNTGSYLVQPIPEERLLAWRIANEKAENLLLIRLLAFTYSHENPLAGTLIVFRSD